MGYATNPQGKVLTGEAEGDWRANWIVIGEDETCGDPIFIDAAQERFPGVHGYAWSGCLDTGPDSGDHSRIRIRAECSIGSIPRPRASCGLGIQPA